MSPNDHAHRHEGHSRPDRAPHGGDACCGSAPPAQAADPAAARMTFKVRGLDCAEEVSILKREVGPLVGGGDHLAFDVLNGRMMVLESADATTAEAIRSAVGRTGMAADPWRPGRGEDGAEIRHRRLQVGLTAASGLCLAAGLALHVWIAGGVGEAIRLFAGHGGAAMPVSEVAAYALAVVFGIYLVLPKAWFAARRLRPDINLLMVIAVAGAIAIGEWFEAATVAFLFALSLTLENWSVGRARRAISALLDLAPPTVRMLRDDGEEAVVPAAEAAVGCRFVVRPGERIPLDGRILTGSSHVNQAPITGESVPVAKQTDDEVFAGTVNGDGALEAESTKPADDTTLARIIRMVEEAHGRRAKAEQWVERFARVYTPAVIALALAVFMLPPLVADAMWSEWFYRALVLLVIACPCALVISTPVSIVAALAAAARQGVLVKGGAFVEQPARLRAIVFDKTGTLTRGEPEVVRLLPLDGHTEAELLARAAALEARSSHPLARAVQAYAASRGMASAPAGGLQVLQGRGATGTFDGEPFWLGSHRYMVERGQDDTDVVARAEEMERQGHTVVAIGNDRHVCGLIAVADTVRPEAAAALRELRAGGVSHLVMLTGDNATTAAAIAAELGIDDYRAELLPEDKVEAVDRLVAEHGRVAMVGDGVNDAPAMARAGLGIAMGAAGTDAAIETADVALMTDDLSRLPWLVGHSRRTLAIIRQNVVVSLAIKAVFVALTFAGLATLWGAILADVGASLLVVSNALRLLGRPPKVAAMASATGAPSAPAASAAS